MAETLEPTDTRAGWICWVRPRYRTAAASLALVLTLVSVNGLHSAARGQSVPAVTRSNETPRPTPSMSTPRAGATQDTGSPQDMPGDTRSAQALFEQGLKRAQDGRWAAARDNFRRAYMIVPRPALLFNLAGAQARSGNMLAAHANYQRLLQGSYPEIGPAHRQAANTQMKRLAGSIPRLKLDLRGLKHRDRVLLDSQRLYQNELALEQWIDPGRHRLVVYMYEGPVRTWTVDLDKGEHKSLTVVLRGGPGRSTGSRESWNALPTQRGSSSGP